MLGPFNITLRN